MKIKNFIKTLLPDRWFPRLREDENIDRLHPRAEISLLPGSFEYAISLGYYSMDDFHNKSDMGRLIRLMKYHYSLPAADRLASFMIDFLEDHPLPLSPDLIVTIPDSLTNRPFRPAAYLADAVAARFGWQARHDIIRRIRLEKPQKDRSFEERLADTRPRYGLENSKAVRGRQVLLFDDIYATGRSLTEAADLIYQCVPASLMILTLARLGSPPVRPA